MTESESGKDVEDVQVDWNIPILQKPSQSTDPAIIIPNEQTKKYLDKRGGIRLLMSNRHNINKKNQLYFENKIVSRLTAIESQS